MNRKYFIESDVNQVARNLLGKVLCTQIHGKFTAGMITEVEAYGLNDRACHAYQNRRTKRTEVMFLEGGHSYVYLCYGIHHLFNIVTNKKDRPEAILIRSIEPIEGVDTIRRRRKRDKIDKGLSSGPGVVSQALGIDLELNRHDLTTSESIWVEDRKIAISPQSIHSTTRIGIDYAQEDALLPWRYYLKSSPFVSKK